jgi:hypothetical protein
MPLVNVELNRLADHLGRPLLCVVHSDRPVQEAHNDINYLERRFASPLRLPPAEPLETLAPARAFTPYLGAISAYDIGETGDQPPVLVCAFRPDTYKPSHAMWHNDRLWVLGTEHIEVYDAQLESLTAIYDPWLAGGHTIAPDGRGRVLVSCSASDAILAFDEDTGGLSQVWRVPEAWYGRNYPLSREHSVVDHYIHNDSQLTHINCAWPWRGGFLVSLLIPGVIGWSDGNGDYREIVRGFVGCHGARVRSDIEEIYFSDSCSGMLVFVDRHGDVIRRVGTGSRWLHDAVQIHGDLFAMAPFDHNEVLLMNVATREVTGRIPCASRGGPQFLSFGGPHAAAVDSARRQTHREAEFPMGSPAPRPKPDEAALRRQHAAMIQSRDEMVRAHSEALRARDALLSGVREERHLAVTTRDDIIAGLHAQQTHEVGRRDGIIAGLHAQQTHEVGRRDGIIAGLHAQQAREVGTRDAIIAELQAQQGREAGTRDRMLADFAAAREQDIAVRDAAIAALRTEHARAVESQQAVIEELRRDAASVRPFWRRWITGRRGTS